MSKNYYELLQIDPLAPKEDIEAAIMHAEISGTINPITIAGMIKILLDATKRRIYDINVAKILPPDSINSESTDSEYCLCEIPHKGRQTNICLHCKKRLRAQKKPSLFRYIH